MDHRYQHKVISLSIPILREQHSKEYWYRHMSSTYSQDSLSRYIEKMDQIKAIYAELLARYDLRGKKALVLGVGKGYDIPLDEICRRYEQVIFLDIDTNSMEEARSRLPVDLHARVKIKEADLALYNATRYQEAIDRKDALIKRINEFGLRTELNMQFMNANQRWKVVPAELPDYISALRGIFQLLAQDISGYEHIPEFTAADLIVTSKVLGIANTMPIRSYVFNEVLKALKLNGVPVELAVFEKQIDRKFRELSDTVMKAAVQSLHHAIVPGGYLILQESDAAPGFEGLLEGINDHFRGQVTENKRVGSLEVVMLQKF